MTLKQIGALLRRNPHSTVATRFGESGVRYDEGCRRCRRVGEVDNDQGVCETHFVAETYTVEWFKRELRKEIRGAVSRRIDKVAGLVRRVENHSVTAKPAPLTVTNGGSWATKIGLDGPRVTVTVDGNVWETTDAVIADIVQAFRDVLEPDPDGGFVPTGVLDAATIAALDHAVETYSAQILEWDNVVAAAAIARGTP